MRALIAIALLACSSPHDEPRHDPPANPAHRGSATPTIAIAVVYNGDETWVGNDDYEHDENLRYQGRLHVVARAIDAYPLAKVGSPGSLAVVVSYATGADIKLPMGPLARLTGAVLGTQADYRGKAGADVVAGVSLGLSELARVSADRKLLITIGQLPEPNDSAAWATLAMLATPANLAGIERFAILLQESPSNDGPIETPLGRTEITETAGGIVAILHVDIDRL